MTSRAVELLLLPLEDVLPPNRSEILHGFPIHHRPPTEYVNLLVKALSSKTAAPLGDVHPTNETAAYWDILNLLYRTALTNREEDALRNIID